MVNTSSSEKRLAGLGIDDASEILGMQHALHTRREDDAVGRLHELDALCETVNKAPKYWGCAGTLSASTCVTFECQGEVDVDEHLASLAHS